MKQQKLGNINGKKNNRMDISSDKLARLLTRRHGHRLKKKKKRETSREKCNRF